MVGERACHLSISETRPNFGVGVSANDRARRNPLGVPCMRTTLQAYNPKQQVNHTGASCSLCSLCLQLLLLLRLLPLLRLLLLLLLLLLQLSLCCRFSVCSLLPLLSAAAALCYCCSLCSKHARTSKAKACCEGCLLLSSVLCLGYICGGARPSVGINTAELET